MTARARYPLDAPSKCATQGCDGDPGWNRMCTKCLEEWAAVAEWERQQAARHQVWLDRTAIAAQLRGGRRRRMRERALVVLAVLWLILAMAWWP